MNHNSHHKVLRHPSHCGSPAATPSLAQFPQTLPFYAHDPQQRHGRSHLIRAEHVRPCLPIPVSRPSPNPGANQIPIAQWIGVTLVVLVAVSFLALC